MVQNNQEYNFNNVILIESNFKRVPDVNSTSSEYKNNLTIDLESQKSDNILSVFLTVKIVSGVEEVIDVEIQVKMVGIFQKNESINQIDIDTFGKVNAPAIIFPFIREHIASLTTKAGIPTILLPPINFVKMAGIE